SLRGSLIASMAANHMSSSTKLDFSGPRASRRPRHGLEQRRSALEASIGAGPYERVGLRLVTVQIGEEAVESNSVL
ncbi:MAG TPA: hypothetical protein VED41_09240, partial [Solirubrobacteraceae bacterium]|nr:hypothetical protein [Solirubrobacteraceae bacterium]